MFQTKVTEKIKTHI